MRRAHFDDLDAGGVEDEHLEHLWSNLLEDELIAYADVVSCRKWRPASLDACSAIDLSEVHSPNAAGVRLQLDLRRQLTQLLAEGFRDCNEG